MDQLFWPFKAKITLTAITPMLISDNDVVIRLLVSMLLSGLIGLEREYHGKPAGLRTNVMVGLGSTLITVSALHVLDVYPDLRQYTASHVISTILTGIGFIGAGAILRPTVPGENVIGLTTASTLWVVTGIGIAVGMGFYFEAFLTAALVFFTFGIVSGFVTWVRRYAKKHPPSNLSEEDKLLNMTDATREH